MSKRSRVTSSGSPASTEVFADAVKALLSRPDADLKLVENFVKLKRTQRSLVKSKPESWHSVPIESICLEPESSQAEETAEDDDECVNEDYYDPMSAAFQLHLGSLCLPVSASCGENTKWGGTTLVKLYSLKLGELSVKWGGSQAEDIGDWDVIVEGDKKLRTSLQGSLLAGVELTEILVWLAEGVDSGMGIPLQESLDVLESVLKERFEEDQQDSE